MSRIVFILVFVLMGVQQGFARSTIDLGQFEPAVIVNLETAASASLTQDCCDEIEVSEDRQSFCNADCKALLPLAILKPHTTTHDHAWDLPATRVSIKGSVDLKPPKS